MKPMFTALLISASLIAATEVAKAEVTVQASAGHAVSSSNEACFRSNYVNGGIQNSCGSAQYWEIALAGDTQAGKGFQAIPSGFVSSSTQCILRVFDRYGNFVTQSPWRAFVGGLQNQDMNGAPLITTGGQFYQYGQLQCLIGVNEILRSVAYWVGF